MSDKGMETNQWVNTDTGTFYFGSDGKAVAGRKVIKGIAYYFDKYGVLRRGWATIDGKKYYFHNGGMLTGPFILDNVLYNFGEGGYIKAGWVRWNTYLYYNDSQGRPYRNGTKRIDGKVYSFDSNGVATLQQ